MDSRRGSSNDQIATPLQGLAWFMVQQPSWDTLHGFPVHAGPCVNASQVH